MANWKADDGTLINYEVVGDAANNNKEVLLLLPGMLGSMATEWQHFSNALAADFRLVMMDLRGHGRSENGSPELLPERMVQDIAGLLDYLQVDQVHISGYSLGGYLGLMLALAQPRRVRSLFMHATKFYWSQDAAQKMRTQLDPDQMAQKVPAYADQLMQLHGARNWRILVRQAADMVNFLVKNGLTEKMAARTQCPVIVSIGDRDELVPLPEALRLSRVLPQGELFVMPGVRHPFNAIRPVPFIPMIQTFHKNADKR